MLRRRTLREPNDSLDNLLEYGRTLELSEQQAAGMEQNVPASVNAVHQTGRTVTSRNAGGAKPNAQCRNCGGKYPHDGECPAKGKDCNACRKLNHFTKQCMSKQRTQRRDNDTKHRDNSIQHRMHKKVYNITSTTHSTTQDSSSSDEAYVFAASSSKNTMQPHTHIRLNGVKVAAMIDSGAAVNIISESVLSTLRPCPQFSPADIKIFPYGNTKPLPITGAFTCSTETDNRQTLAKFYVMEGDSCSLLGYNTAKELGLIKIINTVSASTSQTVADELVQKYSEQFEGIGMLKHFQVMLHINTDIQPTCQPHRRVPFHIRQKVEEELKRLENDDVIETVTGPTPWVSPIMTPPKPKDQDKVRICVDMRQANTAIQRERHITHTMDDIIHKLNGATVFSKLDLTAGYHQLELHPDSRTSISAPLRELTRKDTLWHWNPEHARALQTIKDSLTSNTVMSYFDPAKDTELVEDASPVGLSAILYQKNRKGERHTIAYASRALSDVERRYSQTEKEALANVWSCEHFHLYLYGTPFILVTDHKALEVIWNNPRSKPPARIERWGLRLQPYNLKVEYRKGADHPADYISRQPIPMQTSESTRAVKVAEENTEHPMETETQHFFEYRATPNSTTEASSAELLFQQRIHTKIPLITTCETTLITPSESGTRLQMKSNSDERRRPTTQAQQTHYPIQQQAIRCVRGQRLHDHGDQ
ncbi:hypothetical protein DPEC_G00261320 [Dallia pectoralis]|uniref:Uncharacterized protein n=1 Tax=Dallia pectoralis TaxID=75939 RepID=A0ACC2FRU0_DALPE|nr:hypothetical protein DPEC_G00261320 [Dallia pectoralis]